MKTKFDLGRVVVTRGIDERMKDDSDFYVFVLCTLYGRYAKCDWGDTCEEDKITDDTALQNGERILAIYIYPKTKEKIWIITEWDRSVTTILFPEEY